MSNFWKLLACALACCFALACETTGPVPGPRPAPGQTGDPRPVFNLSLRVGEKIQIILADLPGGGQISSDHTIPEDGKITLHLAADNSPIAVGNFVALASCGFYDDVIFHRIATMQDGTPFVIQGGDPLGTGKGGPGYLIDDEPVIGTYRRGTVAMARTSEPNSQGSQFFIVLSDAAAGPLEQARTYAILGEVSAGMDTVDAISQVPLACGTQPIDPVVIESVSVTRTTP